MNLRNAANKVVLLLGSISLAACTGKLPTSAEDTPGQRWLQMGLTDRAGMVGAFIDGFQLASIQACGLLEAEFKPDSPEVVEEIRRLKLTPSELCRIKTGQYSRASHGKDVRYPYADYIDEITRFYQNYPDHRYVSPDALLLRLKDGEDQTPADLYRDYK